MTLRDAEKIVQQYGSALTARDADDGPASCASRLPASPETIIQAMKLWLAHDIQNRCLKEEFRNQIGTGASILPRFIEDREAHRLNETRRVSRAPARCQDLSTQEFMAAINAIREVDDRALNADIAGLSLRRDLADFITAVEELDPSHERYWQHVDTLIGLR